MLWYIILILLSKRCTIFKKHKQYLYNLIRECIFYGLIARRFEDINQYVGQTF